MNRSQILRIVLTPLPLLLALLAILGFIVLLQALTDVEAGPQEILNAIVRSVARANGEISSRQVANVLEFWIPLVLVSMGLVMTFRAGLWNIGVEGQMVFGGLFAAGFVYSAGITDPVLLIPLTIIAAMLGGGLWALLAGVLRTRFGVNEIFSGVALNALANQITLQLIAGPWRPTDSDKAQYSRDFPEYAVLPGIARDFDVSLLGLIVAVVACAVVLFVVWRTRWGLNLKATGRNANSALLLGVPVGYATLSAMFMCGALAGIGGMHRLLFTDGRVEAQFSGQIGFLGLLVVLLVGSRSLLVPFVALLFAIILQSGTRLQFINLDSSLTGVLQGLLVLFVLLFSGVRDRLQARLSQPSADDSDTAPDPPPTSQAIQQ